jgi:hypothetical protein
MRRFAPKCRYIRKGDQVMKAIRGFSFARLSALLLTAFGLSTAIASAQSAMQGTFTLPMETHWEKSVLPSGVYSFKVELQSFGPLVTVHSADNKLAVMFLARSLSETRTSNTQDLVLDDRNGEMFVSSFRLGSMGIALNYGVPKGVMEAASVAPPAEHPAQPAVVAASTH